MAKRGKRNIAPIAWLPVDSRLIVPFLSFGHVRGVARIFLQIEMFLSVLVVAGTIAIALFRILA